MSPPIDQRRDPRQRAERATRILDVAAELLLRHGYRRITVDDVAAGAGIGKGTVYLHWKTREELFTAVFEREVLHAIEELLRALHRDPQVCLLHQFARAYFVAIMNRPLLRGFILADADLLGRLARSPEHAGEQRHQLMSRAYLELLAAHDLLRHDMDVDEVAYAFQATFEGFLEAETAAPSAAGGHVPAALPQRADLLARTVQRAFESGRNLPRQTQQSLASAVIDLLTELVEADRAELGATRI